MYLRHFLVPLKSLRKKCSVFNVSPGNDNAIQLVTKKKEAKYVHAKKSELFVKLTAKRHNDWNEN